MAWPAFGHVIELARAHGLVVFSDEVYRELEYDPAGRLPAGCDEYERAVSLASISKSYGLPGPADRLERHPRRWPAGRRRR